MKNHIPTIEELLSRPKRELDAIFRKAADIAIDAKQTSQAREAAAKTLENVRTCLRTKRPTP
jgi:hypothetical protein